MHGFSSWRRVVFSPAFVVFCLLPGVGESQYTPAPRGCPDLLEQAPAERVTFDVQKTLTRPGFVCVRVLNGFPHPIRPTAQGMRLQQRQDQPGRTPHFQNIALVPAPALRLEVSGRIPAQESADWQLPPADKPAPPGIYRVCISYTVFGQQSAQEGCSPEFSLSQGQDISPLPGCPRLLEQGPAYKVSVYAAKAVDKPGSICARVVNGSGTGIERGVPGLWVYQWEAEQKEFQAVKEPDLEGIIVNRIARGLAAGEVLDRRLPYSRQPLAPGRYKACFRFGKSGYSDYRACSEEVTLP